MSAFGVRRTPRNRLATKAHALTRLRELGAPPATVLDVGVAHATHELIAAFPKARHLLFEPVPHFAPAIHAHYAGVDHELIQAAVGEAAGEALLRINPEDALIGHSQLTQPPLHDSDTASEEPTAAPAARGGSRIVTSVVTLDGVLADRSEPTPYLLKIDVDGFEAAVLAGAVGTLPHVACLIVEAATDRIGATIAFCQQHGFFLWDVVDLCYAHGVLWQADLVFLPEGLRATCKPRPEDPPGPHGWPPFQDAAGRASFLTRWRRRADRALRDLRGLRSGR